MSKVQRVDMRTAFKARTAATTVLVALVACAALSGCSGGSSDNAATPETTSLTTAGAVADSSATTSPEEGSSPNQSPTSTEALPRLSDTGLGELELGLNLKQVRALGLLGKTLSADQAELCTSYKGKNGVKTLYFNNDKLVIIDIGPELKLDTGLGVGNTYGDLHGAYGDRLGSESGEFGGGRVYIDAPGAPFHAEYRIGLNTTASFRNSKVTEIALQAVELGCYE